MSRVWSLLRRRKKYSTLRSGSSWSSLFFIFLSPHTLRLSLLASSQEHLDADRLDELTAKLFSAEGVGLTSARVEKRWQRLSTSYIPR